MDISNEVNALVGRVIECVDLSIPPEKVSSVKALVDRHASDLMAQIGTSENKELISSKFSNFINKTLSTIETMDLQEKQYKAVRKLILAEINGCCEFITKGIDKREKEKETKQ
jgi:hypothetical protein